jgi:[protein-PII] uridylyltransferase
MLWDLHMKVGHASRTVKECLRLGRQDITIRTSLLEMRFLCGTEPVGADLQDALRKQLFDGTVGEFIEAKLDERSTRHRKQGGQRYMLEPNVKEGKGGLRDLQTLYWIAKYEHGVDRIDELVDRGVFRPEEFAAFDAAERFLWAIRCHLHLIADRAQDQMTFDNQVQVAARMGYEDHSGRRAVEHFMQDYFRHATRVGELTRIFLTELEARHVKQEPAILGFLRGRTRRRKKVKDGYEIKQNRITVEDPGAFFADKLNMLRLFEEALRTGYLIHPDAMREVQARLDTIDDAMRRDPEAVRIFLDLMLKHGNPERALRRMNELGVLSAFLPEFAPVVAMMQFNMYHSYTVDEHTIQVISTLAQIEREELIEELPVASRILKAGRQSQGSLRGLPAARYRQGQEGGPFDRRRPHRARGLSPPRPQAGRMRHGGMAGALSPPDVRHGAETRYFRSAHHSRFRQGGENAGAAGTADRADGLRHSWAWGQTPGTTGRPRCCAGSTGPPRPRWRRGWRISTAKSSRAKARRRCARHSRTGPRRTLKAEIDRHYGPYWQGLDVATQVTFAEMLRGLDTDDIRIDTRQDTDRDATRVCFRAGRSSGHLLAPRGRAEPCRRQCRRRPHAHHQGRLRHRRLLGPGRRGQSL